MQLAETGSKLDTGRRFFLPALDLLADPQAFYRAAGDQLRRSMNQLIFRKLYLDEDGVDGMELAPGFRELFMPTVPRWGHGRPKRGDGNGSPDRPKPGLSNLVPRGTRFE